VRCTRIGKNVVEIYFAKSIIATGYPPGSSQAAVGVVDLRKFAPIEIIERDDSILDSSRCDRFLAHKACYAAIAAFLIEKLQKLGPNQTRSPRYNGIARKLQGSSFVDIAPSHLRSCPNFLAVDNFSYVGDSQYFAAGTPVPALYLVYNDPNCISDLRTDDRGYRIRYLLNQIVCLFWGELIFENFDFNQWHFASP